MQSERTHRDTLAFALAIVGASMWALYPIGTAMRHHTESRLVWLLAVTMAGAGLGAWTAATVWRRVSLATPAVAGALFGALIAGIADLRRCGTVDMSLDDVKLVGGVAVAALAGAALGRLARKPRVALAAAWITMSAIALFLLAVAATESVGYGIDPAAGGLVLFFGAFPGGIVAVILCRDVTRRALCLWLMVLCMAGLTAAGIANIDPQKHSEDAIMAGVIFGLIFAANAAGAHATVMAVRRRRRARASADMPAARVVER